MAFDPTLLDSTSRMRFAVGDTQATELLSDATYAAVLSQQSGDEAASIRAIAAALAARYAIEPTQIGSDGSSIVWSERVAQWRLIASGTAGGSGSSVGKGITITRSAPRDWTAGGGDAI